MRPTNCRFGFFPKDFLSYLAQAGKLGVITEGGGGGCALLSTCQGGEAGGEARGEGEALLSTCQEEEQEDKEEVKEVENEQAPHLPASHHPLSTC